MSTISKYKEDLKRPSLAVTICCYNSEKYLDDCIKSILQQSYPYFDLIILDDGSTDNTSKILKKYQQQDPRIIVLQHKSKKGIPYSRNALLQFSKSKYDYLAIMDSDDIMSYHRLKKQTQYLNKHLLIDALGTYMFSFQDNNDLNNISNLHMMYVPINSKLIHSYMLFQNCCLHPSIMIRTNILEQHPSLEYNTKYKTASDYSFFLQICKVGKVKNLDQFLTFYRIHPASVSKSKENEQKTNGVYILKEYYKNYEINISFRFLKKMLNKKFTYSSFEFKQVFYFFEKLLSQIKKNNEMEKFSKLYFEFNILKYFIEFCIHQKKYIKLLEIFKYLRIPQKDDFIVTLDILFYLNHYLFKRFLYASFKKSTKHFF